MPMRLRTDTPAATEAAIAAGVRALVAGELIGLPTETVYGLGARADDAQAVARIFAAKGRPSDHPLIVHVADAAGAEAFAAELPAVARRLMAAFWPGPLTVIVPRRDGVAAAAAGGQTSIGLRCPAHPLAQALLRAAALAGVPGVAAPSANRFGRVSPTRAAHVVAEFADIAGLADLPVLDGGDCALGIESAIVDCSRGHAVLLRPGSLDPARIEAAAGEPLRARDAAAPRASGTLAAHYAPRATLRLLDTAALQVAVELLLAPSGIDPLAADPDSADAVAGEAAARAPAAPRLAVYSRGPRPHAPTGLGAQAASPVWWREMPGDPDAAAHELFAALREFDDRQIELIWVEAPPADARWDGVRDRLQRAAAAA